MSKITKEEACQVMAAYKICLPVIRMVGGMEAASVYTNDHETFALICSILRGFMQVKYNQALKRCENKEQIIYLRTMCDRIADANFECDEMEAILEEFAP